MVSTVINLHALFMAVSTLIGIAIPAILFLVFRKKYQANVAPFFIGCAVFIVFALLFENFIHKLIFATDTGKACNYTLAKDYFEKLQAPSKG